MDYTTSFFAPSGDSPVGDEVMVNIKEERSRGVSEAEPYDAVGSSRPEQQPQQSHQPDSHQSSQTDRHPSQTSSSPPRKRSISQFGADGSLDEEMPPSTRSNSKAAAPAPKPAASKSAKKGKATVVKAPKRSGGGSKKSKSKSKKASTQRRGSTAGTGTAVDGDEGNPDEDVDDGAGGDESSDGEDSGPYCICRGPDNHKFMIFCESCEDWFHGECVKMDKYTGDNLVERYICPNCTTDRNFTRYKKTCALEGCQKVARLYDGVPKERQSKFCCDEHTQLWWERLIATLPRQKTGGADQLTQGEFMGLLGNGKTGAKDKDGEEDGDGWKLGDEPFGTPPDFWEKHPASEVFTDEETSLLASSAAGRQALGEEIFLSRKMLTILDYAVKNRESLVTSSSWPTIQKDFCGYDYRLDSIGAPAPFAAFVSGEGAKILESGKLDLPAVKNDMEALSGLMCTKKKCKPHATWINILRKMVNHQIKELAAQAKEKLDYEARIRDCAAVRFRRKQKEFCAVEVVGGFEDDGMED